MPDAYSRTEALLGEDHMDRLSCAKIAVFGVGGIGSHIIESLARCGVGSFTLIDGGQISITDLNRHLFAVNSNVGGSKVEAAKKRISEIDEDILVRTYDTYYTYETESMFELKDFDYVIDAMDIPVHKVLLLVKCRIAGVPVLSCMAIDNRKNPRMLEISDISRASGCDYTKQIKMLLQKNGVRKQKILYSREKMLQKIPFVLPLSLKSREKIEEERQNGNISYMAWTAGALAANEVIRDLLTVNKKKKYTK